MKDKISSLFERESEYILRTPSTDISSNIFSVRARAQTKFIRAQTRTRKREIIADREKLKRYQKQE